MAEREKVMLEIEKAINEADSTAAFALILTHTLRDALVLLKEQEPRVMTLEEVIQSHDWIWYQWKNTHCGWTVAVNCDGKWIEWEDSTTDQLCKYGEKWRCWTSRPTPEQMRDTKWEGDSDAEIH